MSKKSPSYHSLRVSLIALTMGFMGCVNQAASTSFTQTTTVNENLPQVVATTSVLCDLTKQVAGNTINLSCLISPSTDSDFYQPKPEDRQAIEQANLILYNGYNLEPELIKIIKATKNSAPKRAVAQQAVPKPQQFQKNGKKVADPYIWHNPKNAIKMVEIISSNLEKLEPSNAVIYSDNAKQIKNELTQMNSWIKSRIASIPVKQPKLVTTYNELGYYTKAYNISLVNFSIDEKPTDIRVKNLVKNLQRTKVPTIFAQTKMNPNLVQSIATEAQVKVSERELLTEGLGEPGSEGDTYQKMMINNTRTIVEGLGGTYLMFAPKDSQ
ncbi:metal ABC transporter solute-binding protein, Zn/Mn family [Halotia branconii]|uniref:Zinc ABC transporter substrate-binding protein n=1 Tax=Halotia branconii CENA392 TaxID=1539056 RepID=A0AAJ6NY56_9CYAN|nr:zinc ABC transporter substrate-binding protein [Halotia branconii]WGV28807.1 zinc ABC transporter substrate-binding protein [Halotia branconii CENA392]